MLVSSWVGWLFLIFYLTDFRQEFEVVLAPGGGCGCPSLDQARATSCCKFWLWVLVFCDVFQKFVDDEKEVALFDDGALRPGLADIEQHAKRIAASRALMFREQLRRSGRYEGSKLALMDDFQVKRSDFSVWPIYVVKWKVARPKKPRAKAQKRTKRERQKLPEVVSGENSGRKSSRPRKRFKEDKNFDYYA